MFLSQDVAKDRYLEAQLLGGELMVLRPNLAM